MSLLRWEDQIRKICIWCPQENHSRVNDDNGQYIVNLVKDTHGFFLYAEKVRDLFSGNSNNKLKFFLKKKNSVKNLTYMFFIYFRSKFYADFSQEILDFCSET